MMKPTAQNKTGVEKLITEVATQQKIRFYATGYAGDDIRGVISELPSGRGDESAVD